MSNYVEYRKAVGISNKDMIRAIKGSYRKYSGATNAMVNNPDSYGVCLLPQAEKLLAANFGYGNGLAVKEEKPVRKPSVRKRPNRISVYLTDKMYEKVKAIMQDRGYDTFQDFLLDILVENIGGLL